jgi:hypothetical protein
MRQIRNPKSEIRKKLEAQSPKSDPLRQRDKAARYRQCSRFPLSGFDIRIFFGFRHSDFGFSPAAALLLLVCFCGCATQRGATAWQVLPVVASETQVFAHAERALREAFPPQYRGTHRAIITASGRQFVCDGFLNVSPADGCHLALVSALGLITDVRVKADGDSEILKVTPLFREEWSREHVARELRWLFTPPPSLAPVGRLSDGRLVLEGTDAAGKVQARYLCRADDGRWEELELRVGARRVFHARLGGHRLFAGLEREIPTDIELDAGTHKLHLRIVALTVMGDSATEVRR